MRNYQKLFTFVILLFISLFLTSTPYINAFLAGKIWIFYLLLLLYLFPPKNITYILYFTYVSFFALIISTLFGLGGLAEMIGVLVFTLFCIVFAMGYYKFIKGT